MHPTASFCCLLLTVLLHFNDARLVPVEHAANEPLAIDAISANALPIANHGIIKRQAMPLPRATANTTVCYPLVGCYDNNEPFNNAALEVPQSPEFINTAFLFYSQESPTNPELLAYDNDDSIQKVDINPSRWLRIIVHGFTNNRESVWMKKMKDELLKLTNDELSDVMLVDWGDGAKFPAYANAASNTRLVGKQIGLLLEKLQATKGISYDKVHCIGHSLGAHTCGAASFSLGSQLARVSGLDPAGPFFSGKKPAVRLDKDDAKFVDVIHSNTEIALGLGLGSADESGHIDFYVNGGQSQPGCPSMGALLGGVIGGQSQAAYEQASCSHGRAHGYFIESIHSECPYTAFPCHDYDSFMDGKCLVCPITGCAQMGFYSIYSLGRGRMYSTTKSASPFCGYHYFIEMVLDRDMVKTGGEVFVAVFSDYEMLANVSMTKSGADIKSGDIIRHVFSYQADLGNVDYAIVYFSKAKSFLGWGGQKGNELVISRLRLKSLEDSAVYSGPCETSTSVTAYTSETILLHRFDCLE